MSNTKKHPNYSKLNMFQRGQFIHKRKNYLEHPAKRLVHISAFSELDKMKIFKQDTYIIGLQGALEWKAYCNRDGELNDHWVTKEEAKRTKDRHWEETGHSTDYIHKEG